ncbi:hypothetical protein [Kordiimonas laminariae]|uniref:hypothetical protein n=1 Tax=Kordiimonas laminariae TaxID=2917717 RepID=UPI001FF3BCF2|nr:hypothetical protein [Kordiimonas laminariae]MCK0069821.1 hypothetical protein [Kordiimonas laminariae]
MSISAKHIYSILSEWPERKIGSEDEMMAREALMTELLAEPDVEIAEEGLRLPRSIWFIEFVMVSGALGAIWMASIMPYIALLVGLLLVGCFMLHMDGRRTPIDWLVPSVISSNLVAKKGSGKRLYIVSASLDNDLKFLNKKVELSVHKNIIFYAYVFVFLWAVIIPVFYILGFGLAGWFELLITVSLLSIFCLYRVSMNDMNSGHLAGVAAATSAACGLWRKMPHGTEVRLVVSTGGRLLGYGLEHYLKHHASEFEERDIYVLNYDTPQNEEVAYIGKAGVFTSTGFENIMKMVAQGLVKLNPSYSKIRAIDADTVLPESVLCARKGYTALTITSKLGVQEKPDLEAMEKASKFGEAILRMLPEMKGKRDAR